MIKDYGKIFGFVVFLIVSTGILYLSLFTYSEKGKEKIKTIKVTGNSFLSSERYMKLTGLDRQQVYNDLNLNIIKRKFEKHPYVANAFVKSDGRGNVDIKIDEKTIYAVLLKNEKTFFITSEFELLEIQNYTTYSDIPVISNVSISGKINASTKLKNNDLTDAFRIIEASKIVGDDFAKKLSEINLKNGGNIVLTFSGVNYPILFGRGNESKKIVGLNMLWIKYKNLNENLSSTAYIDLRFSNSAYIGSKENAGLM